MVAQRRDRPCRHMTHINTGGGHTHGGSLYWAGEGFCLVNLMMLLDLSLQIVTCIIDMCFNFPVCEIVIVFYGWPYKAQHSIFRNCVGFSMDLRDHMYVEFMLCSYGVLEL